MSDVQSASGARDELKIADASATAAQTAQQQRDQELILQQDLYTPLGPKQTRILKIHPTNGASAEVVCDLLVVDLGKKAGATIVGTQKKLGYDALSYTWGNPTPTERIRVNDRPFWISKSLFEALRHLRYNGKRERLLWNDACCINQKDLPEKSKQVTMMFDIYRRAAKTVVWLGRPTTDKHVLFEAVKMFYEDALSYRDVNQKTTRKALLQFLEETPWFERTWIRQEIHAARTVEICYGNYSSDIHQFVQFLEYLLPELDQRLDLFQAHNDPRDGTTRAKLIFFFFRQHAQASDDLSYCTERERHLLFFRMIMRGSLYQATMPHDKVYAALGIVAQMTKSGADPRYAERLHYAEGFPEVDYSKSVSHVFQDFVKHDINVSGQLQALTVVQNRDAIGDDLPSWAIDLRINVPRYQFPLGMANDGDYKGSVPTQSFNDLGLLKIEGWRIGTVTSAAGSFPSSTDRETSTPGQIHGLGLHGCFSSDHVWNPRHENNKGLEEIWSVIKKQCAYVWSEFQPCEGIIAEDMDWQQQKSKDADQARYFCVAPHTVRAADIIVSARGATAAIVVRPQEGIEGRYTLVGPTMLTSGYVKKLKDREMYRYSLTRLRRNLDWDKLEKFELA